MPEPESDPIRIFLCGDVMTGRGVDQILPTPSEPVLYERWMTSALDYVALAERRYGPIPRRADVDYVWGDALDLMRRASVDVRIANLETSVTRSDRPCLKGINYRMAPENVGVLQAAGFDVCVLANNHTLDWGRPGLIETLETLRRAGVTTAGAGRDLGEARAPAVVGARGKGRVLIFALAAESSGVPPDWAAETGRPGVNLTELSSRSLQALVADIDRARRPGDVVVVSIHWGGNWGYAIPTAHKAFAHELIRDGGVSIVHGHSSHHPMGVEVFEGGLALYGCGDFLNDYEGIGGYEAYLSDLALGYVAGVDPDGGRLLTLEAHPFRIAGLRLNRASAAEAHAVLARLNRESAPFDVQVELMDGRFVFRWRD